MSEWTIARRILLGGGIILLLLLVVGLFSLFSVSRLKKNTETINNDSLPGIVSMSTVAECLFKGHIASLMAGQAETPENRVKFTAYANEQALIVTAALENYEKSIFVEEDRQNFAQLNTLRAKYLEARKMYLEMLKEGQDAQAIDCLAERLDPAFAPYRDQVSLVLKYNADSGRRTASASLATASQSLWAVGIMVVVAFVIAVANGFFTIRGINTALSSVASSLADASAQVASASAEVAGASQTLAHGASEQAAALEETSASVEELSSMAKRNSENSVSAQNLAKETRAMTHHGAQRMDRLVKTMAAIKSSSDNIAKVVKTIDEIAFQTNILALNAAVEAARAGEAGAGFAVVADEVRSLAQRAAAASRESAGMIEESIRTSGEGATLTADVSESLGKIDQRATKVGDLVNEITTASQEQAQGLTQISTGVTQMDKVTQSNASNAEETAAAAEELSAQSVVMKESVEQLLKLVGGSARKA